ncbi:MAG: 50S ribosomal protein L30 [archaeon]|nr:50S ribosomal protein L30 [Candidatus Micrarchaeota archaeon]
MLAIIRIRGSIGVRKEVLDCMNMLNLTRVNHLVLFPEKKEIKGMVEKARDYVTYGEIKEETVEKLLEKRGRMTGDKRVTAEQLKKSKYKSFKEVAKALMEGKKVLEEIGIKKVFRLHPPKKGFERRGIKKPYSIGGVLGYRGEKINELILRMI